MIKWNVGVDVYTMIHREEMIKTKSDHAWNMVKTVLNNISKSMMLVWAYESNTVQWSIGT